MRNLTLTDKTLRAVEAVADIAFNAGNQPVRSKHVMQRLGIPERYLEQVLQALVRNGVLRSVRGPRGGYMLNRAPSDITIGRIARVVSKLDETQSPKIESDLSRAAVASVWSQAQTSLNEVLNNVTISDLLATAREKGIQPALQRKNSALLAD